MNREKLIAAGIDYDGGVHRFSGNSQVYEKYLLKFFNKSELPVLRQMLEKEDYEGAFHTAHNIKGGAGNLSISAFFDKISVLVDALRDDVHDKPLLDLCSEAEKLYEIASDAVKENYDGQAN